MSNFFSSLFKLISIISVMVTDIDISVNLSLMFMSKSNIYCFPAWFLFKISYAAFSASLLTYSTYQ